MHCPPAIKEKAILLRKKGYSIKEVAVTLKISKSTSSLWLRNINLSSTAQARLQKRKILGQYNARLTKIKKQQMLQEKQSTVAKQVLQQVKLSKDTKKLCCALLYWCEGNKDSNFVRFTSSDPSLIKLFLSLLRESFNTDEKKFRVLMHLHQYHKEKQQQIYWNKMTEIPTNQFHKTYWKPNTGKRIHKDYPGCIAISYYDAKVAKQLMAIYNAFAGRGSG